jgi:hypothetical protein
MPPLAFVVGEGAYGQQVGMFEEMDAIGQLQALTGFQFGCDIGEAGRAGTEGHLTNRVTG